LLSAALAVVHTKDAEPAIIVATLRAA